MAQIVVGIGTSHTPQLSMGAKMWTVHSQLVDHMLVDMETNTAHAPAWMFGEVQAEHIEKKYDDSQGHIDQLSKILDAAEPDVVVVFGDDHREVFDDECSPAIALYCGKDAWDLPVNEEAPLESLRAADWAFHGKAAIRYETSGDLACHIVRQMCESGLDPAVVSTLSADRALGHAFTFIKRRFATDRAWSLLPIWLNAFYEPNQLSAKRCYLVGQAVRSAIESWPGNERVAIVASGGLSHYIVDETFDRKLLNAIEQKDASTLTSIPDSELESGTGEVRMWIAAAGALEGLNLSQYSYIPGYRSVAGTGVGFGFAAWT